MSVPAFSCIILLDIHGAVFIEGDDELYIPSLNLKQIGRDGDGDGDADVVCVVSPSNIGYEVYVNRTNDFPTLYQALQIAIQSTNHVVMDGEFLSRLFNSYQYQSYSFLHNKYKQGIGVLEDKVSRGTPHDLIDYKSGLLNFAGSDIVDHDVNARAQETYNALGLTWRAHYDYCIGSKRYCPGGSSNQCWLYFPGVAPRDCNHFHNKLKVFTPPTGHSLFTDLVLRFDTTVVDKCVLVIVFRCSPNGRFNNNLWRGIPLDVFFQQVKQLLVMVFSRDDANRLLSHTTFVDAACSCLSVDQDGKKVSIISFQKAGMAAGVEDGRILASVDIHPASVHPVGFWEYWVHHDKAVRAEAGAGAGAGRQTHRVIIPRELTSFVPDCLTCMGSTITKIEPEFDETGMVQRVVYTYKNGHKVTKDYAVSVPELPTDTMERVVGSVEPHRDDLDYLTIIPESIPLYDSDAYSDSSVGSKKRKRRSRKRKRRSRTPMKFRLGVGGCRCRCRRVLYTSKKKCNKCKMIHLHKKTRKNR